MARNLQKLDQVQVTLVLWIEKRKELFGQFASDMFCRVATHCMLTVSMKHFKLYIKMVHKDIYFIHSRTYSIVL